MLIVYWEHELLPMLQVFDNEHRYIDFRLSHNLLNTFSVYIIFRPHPNMKDITACSTIHEVARKTCEASRNGPRTFVRLYRGFLVDAPIYVTHAQVRFQARGHRVVG